jgi:hypothetical protein
MPRAPTKVILDVRPGREVYNSLHKPAETGDPKNAVQKNIARMHIVRTITALKNVALKNTAQTSIARRSIAQTMREPETTSLRRT